MLDAMSIVPYYTGHLCSAFRQCTGVSVSLASTTYQHDPGFFRRTKISLDRGLIDISWKLRNRAAPLRRFVKGGEYLLNLAGLLARFTRRRPNILHVQFLPLLSLVLPIETWWLRAVRGLGIRIVYTVHNVTPQDGSRSLGAYRSTYGLVDRFICHDSTAADRMISEFGVAASRIVTIPHGPLFEGDRSGGTAPARRRLGFSPSEPLVLWQGILRPYKGISFLLKAWRIVCEHDRRGRLAIVGSGDPQLLRSVINEVRGLGIEDRVRLDLRFVSVAEMMDYFDAADVVVYPYREITTSGALLTGISRKKAIVASRLAAFEQILRHGETALLVDYGDTDSLAAALLRLIADRTERERLGTCLAEQQGAIPRWKEIAERTADCYRSVLSE